MKKQFLALIGGVMVAGLAMAAEVVGNNEAVVIQKAAVKSSTNYQFLCVPVAPLDITGGDAGTLTLAGVLPPELYYTSDEPTVVTIGSASYQVVLDDSGTKMWGNFAEKPQNADGTVLEAGTIFWLKTTKADATVFCGQSIDLVEIPSGQGIVACGNTSSKAKTLPELIPDAIATNGSMVYAIEKGKTTYTIYTYTKFLNGSGIWTNFRTAASANDVEIAAGEAFYYIKK